MMRITQSLMLFFLLIAGNSALAQNSIGVGDTLDAVLPPTGTAEYRFIGEQGQYVTISLVSDDFDAYVTLLDANNNQIASDDDSGEGFNARIGPIRLEAGGVYTIEASSLGGSGGGAYTLSVASAAVRRIDFGQPITGELSETEPTTIYVFAAQAGEAISIELNSDDFDAYLSLDADNPRRNLTADDDSGVGYNARIAPYIIPESGEYSITASRLYSSETGSYTLLLDQVNPEPLTLGTSQEIIMRNSQPLYYSFEGRVDQIVSIQADSNNTLDTTLSLVGPESRVIASDDNSGGFNDPAINDVILDADGTYFITLQLDLDREIALPVTLTLTEGDVPSLDNGPQTIQLDDDGWGNHVLIFDGVANQVAIVRIGINSSQPLSPNVTVSQSGNQFASLSTSSAMGEISLGFVVPQAGPVNVEITDYDYHDAELIVTLEKR